MYNDVTHKDMKIDLILQVMSRYWEREQAG